MAVIVVTSDPRGLLELARAGVNAGEIETWECDADGDFTHNPPQWNKKAWFRPRLESDRIIFNIFPPRGERLSTAVYAIYHGRLIEMLLNHFDRKFSSARATALPTSNDSVGK